MASQLNRTAYLHLFPHRPLLFFIVFLLAGCGGAPTADPATTPVVIAPTSLTPSSSDLGADITSPIVSISAPASGTVSGPITVSATATDPTVSGQITSGIAGVQFKLDGTNMGAEVLTPPYSMSENTTLTTNGAHTVTAVARDTAGNTTTSSAVNIVVSNATPAPDTSAPTTPTGLSATAFSSAQITVSWAVSTDNVGVSGYRVFRNGASLTTVTSTSFQDSGLVPLTSYTYTVQAYDAAGNNSAQSTGASAVTLAFGAKTTLSGLAASLQPGTWGALNVDGDSSGFGQTLLDAGSGHNIVEFADKAVWDSNAHQFHFIGQGHYANQKFVTYTEANNSWITEAKPYWDCSPTCPGHAYQHNALNPATGDIYYRIFNSTSVYEYQKSSGTWIALPAIPLSVIGIAGAIEYFPEMGGLIYVQGRGGNSANMGQVYFYSSTTKQWSMLGNNLPMAEYHNFAKYSPIQKVIIFGGGNNSTDIYRLDASGKITKMNNAPVPIGITQTITTIDPVSGKLLVFVVDGRVYDYDAIADVWTQKASSHPFIDSYGYLNAVAAPIPEYGVVMLMKFDFGQSAVYVYKDN